MLFTYTLLLGVYIHSGAAQTRLNSSQVPQLKGAAQGPFNDTILRDYNSVLDHITGTGSAIAATIAACGTTNTCSIIIPPSYTKSDLVPGYQLDYSAPPVAANTPGNIYIFDRRYGDARMLVNAPGFHDSLQYSAAGWRYDYYTKASQNEHRLSMVLRQLSFDGGNNQQSAALNYSDKTTWATTLSNEISHTPGQHLNFSLGGQGTSLGDFLPINNWVNCYGGYTTEGDLGCRAQDNVIAQGTVEYSGTLTGSPTTGATTLSLTPTQGASTQGSGRFLVRTSAGTISSGTISNFANSVVTGSGTTWPVSTVIGTLGTNIPVPGSAVVTPTFSVGSISGIQTSTLVCVADTESFEMVYPTAVTATTFTANFANIHLSNATISVGGLCGYVMDLTADDVTNATFPTKTQTITGTLHFAWPVITSSSATSAVLWVEGDGVLTQPVTRFTSSANGYVLYPFAEVTSVQQNGGLSDTLTVGPNQVQWLAGDTVSEFIYPAFHMTFGNNLLEAYYPNTGGGDLFGFTYNMPLQGNDAMFSLTNNGPIGFYSSHGGRYFPPTGFNLGGITNQSLVFDQPADTATVAVGCFSSCYGNAPVVAAGNPNYFDFLAYDEANRHWNISANSYSTQYSPASTEFYTPFANVYMANDTRGQGYVATHEFRTNTSSNTDVAGELAFSNSSSATQSLNGSYGSHPECVARPQFDPGSTNRHWITYGATSFTINFSTPVSGNVTYACYARN